jgi:hypothetical protein
MPLDMLYAAGLLITVAVVAFAISAVVGVLVESVLAPPHVGDERTADARLRRTGTTSPDEAPVHEPPSGWLVPVEDPAI